MQLLRLFIAIDLPAAVKQLMSDLQAQMRRHTQAVRWADPNSTHLTLKFLGGTRADAVSAIVAEMERLAVHHRPFQLQTDTLGTFPSLSRPRVVWLGVSGDMPALTALQADVERYIEPLGFPGESRAFSPHLTLGRSVKDPGPLQLVSISGAMQQTKVLHAIVLPVREIVLMRSELGPSGARYHTLAHVPLDGPA